MANLDHGPAEKGSRYCLQRAIEHDQDRLNDDILAASESLRSCTPTRIVWRSPLARDNYQEYRDDFLEVLGLGSFTKALREFWPKGGPQWDGLALIEAPAVNPGVLLVEAKAHPGEMESTCGAESPHSIAMIDRAFAATQAHMRVSGREWKQGFYQLANRLAYLYFMNSIIQTPTWLVLMNFVDDRSHIPTKRAQWTEHLAQVWSWAGVTSTSPLMERVVEVFPEAQK